MLGIYIVLRELTTLTIVRNVLFFNQRFQTRNLRKNGETTLDLLELHSASSHRDFHSRSLASDQSIVVHDVLAPQRILWT